VDTDIIVYDSDEYTPMVTVTLDKEKRQVANSSWQSVMFPSSISLVASQIYRLVALPKDTTNISIYYMDATDDAAVPAMNAIDGGVDWKYTTFNGVPNSGSHAWTDTATRRAWMGLYIEEISASGGGERWG
jgi:hypothetical protein